MKIKREDFLHQLESVQGGLAPRGLIEQSKCVVFQNGFLRTFNDDITCSVPCPLANEITGAVPSEKLIDQLRKWKEEEIEVTVSHDEFVLIGKGKKAGFRLEAEILLPLDSVEIPKDWFPLSDDFGEAINVVKQCTSLKSGDSWTTFIHLHPIWIEACDNCQMCRWNVGLNVKQPVLVKGQSIKAITSFGMVECAEGEAWIHFRNSAGLVFSVRRFVEDYIDLSPMLECEGKEVTLPVGLIGTMEKASIFSSENQDTNFVRVVLKQGKIQVTSKGITGWYKETRPIQWNNEPLSFMASPQLLSDLLKRHNKVILSKNRIKVETDKYTWVAVLIQEEGKTNES